MNRNDIRDLALNKVLDVKTTILNLSTGVGKTKIAIDCINKICDNIFNVDNVPTKVSILVPTKALINNWFVELKKWNCKTDLIDIKCYNSIAKINPYSDIIVLDEAQHLSEKRQDIFTDIVNVNKDLKIIVLSATLHRETMEYIKSLGTYNLVKTTIASAINDEILPTPKIYTIPLILDNKINNMEIIENKNKSNSITCNYNERWTFKKRFPTRKLIIKCTKKQYYDDLSNKIDYYKKRFLSTKTEIMKNKWLRTAGLRLKYLSYQKTDIVKTILSSLQDQRTLTFCYDIYQSEALGCHNIHSKNSKGLQVLDDFNNGKINHITSVNMLNEGQNLYNCRVGVFANINNSDIITQQRNGRLLRHKKPVIIIPYFKDTRDEELKNKMLENYDKNLIFEFKNIEQFKYFKLE